MSNMKNIAVICEGKTEQIFVEKIIAPYLYQEARNIFITAFQITKPGQKGGDVKFERLCNDLRNTLHQSHWNLITTFFDFYGLKGEWPGYSNALTQHTPKDKSVMLVAAVQDKIEKLFQKLNTRNRFLPYFAMHETEALYFSCPSIMADQLEVSQTEIESILSDCSEPEAINHTRETSPSHRIATLLGVTEFTKKTTEGIAIAEAIGLQKMRDECPIFNDWITQMEKP